MEFQVSLVEMSCSSDIEKNMKTILDSIKEEAKRGSSLVVFPELADTGYYLKDLKPDRINQPNSRSHRIAECAKENHIAVVCGLAEIQPPSCRVEYIYNSAVVFDSDGSIQDIYRKIHLFKATNENEVFTPGEDAKAVLIPSMNLKVGLAICYDLRFPELFRHLVISGQVQVLIVIAAFPFPRKNVWSTLLQARAIENQAFVLGVNRCGTDGDITFCGGSQVIDPCGEDISELRTGQSTIRTAKINLRQVEIARKISDALRDSRPEVYFRAKANH